MSTLASLVDDADLPVMAAALCALAPSLALLLVAALTIRRAKPPDKIPEGFGV